ncbi:N(G),N(G)-dimethylarginine dimethylaminohydrolase [Actinomadura darangshiensis]|uniref:N(G),N(G)-dimethylarginine dimethylaminohydrolase n=1 Tax=Actinomadura darangshiensis TaxID=705336 RepID=A0A4R5B6Y5_9ACTN|nr:dimethylargininase [Actinomadura darangshiensis]TDD80823.1 N(G),N(G)-dimethylarginine dimethylaminohydrolase [Actinomadura darangshiensis]
MTCADGLNTAGRALVRPPGPRLTEAIVTHAARRPVDAALAGRQHAAYVAALRSAGWRVGAVAPADDLPDAVFIEDALIVCGDLAILGRSGAAGRRDEVAGAEQAARELGLRIERIKEPGTLDGGDVLDVGDTVYVGRGARTNEEGICQLAHLLGGRKVVPVDISGCLHLKSAMTALPDGGLIGVPEMVDTSVLPCLRVVREPEGAHVVVLGPDHVLMSASAPRTAAQLAADGLRVTSVDIGEFEALDGCVTCLSVLVP